MLLERVKSMKLLEKTAHTIEGLPNQPIVALAHNSYFKKANINEFANILVEQRIYFELNSR